MAQWPGFQHVICVWIMTSDRRSLQLHLVLIIISVHCGRISICKLSRRGWQTWSTRVVHRWSREVMRDTLTIRDLYDMRLRWTQMKESVGHLLVALLTTLMLARKEKGCDLERSLWPWSCTSQRPLWVSQSDAADLLIFALSRTGLSDLLFGGQLQ